MKIKTSELQGPALDWAVGVAQGDTVYRLRVCRPAGWCLEDDPEGSQWAVHAQVPKVDWYADYKYNPSQSWLLGGPIIEREWIELVPWPNESDENRRWRATQYDSTDGILNSPFGPTPLIAAMRCFVASKLGDEVDVPEKLL
jgi:hypothetical protein